MEATSPPAWRSSIRLVGTIARRWDGTPAPPTDHAQVHVEATSSGLAIHVEAPRYGDPPPDGPPGATWALWEHEVVEVFLLGEGERYTEIEIGPAGHWLVLELQGVRAIVRQVEGLKAACRDEGPRWKGSIVIPWSHLPDPVVAWNAYAIHGLGEDREHSALFPVPGDGPDFHRLDCFARLDVPLSSSG